MSEILFKVGDSGGYKDGEVIAIKPDGWLLSAADVKAWVKDGTEPAVFVSMPEYITNRLKRRISRLRYELSHTAEQLAKEFDIKLEDAIECKAIAESDRADFEANGLDTNWGREDLRSHYVVKITNLTFHDQLEFIDQDSDIDHKAEYRRKRRYRIAYENVYSAVELAKIRDKMQRMQMNREISIDKSMAIKPTARSK